MSATDAKVSSSNTWGLMHIRDNCPYASSCLLPSCHRTEESEWPRLDNFWNAFKRPISGMGHQPLCNAAQEQLALSAAGLTPASRQGIGYLSAPCALDALCPRLSLG